MSAPRKRSDAELWRAIEDVAAQAELSRIEVLSEEEVDRELRAAGIEPGQAAKVGQEIGGALPRAAGVGRPRAPAVAGAPSPATGGAISLGPSRAPQPRGGVPAGAR